MKSSRSNNNIDITEFNRILADWPGIHRLLLLYQTLDQSQLRMIDEFVKAILELDEDTRNKFFKVFCNKKYGSFAFIFKAGKCIGFDWRGSYRKPK